MFKRLLSVGLIVSYAFAAESAIVDTAVCVSNKVRVPLYSFNPLADMPLSPYPFHQRPPIFMVTLPHGQRIIVLGTSHVFPLLCMLPYGLAQDLNEQSAFTFNEINGNLLRSNGSGRVNRRFKYKDIPDFAFVSEESKAKLREGQVLIYKAIYKDPNCLDEVVDKEMSSIFAPDGRWYEKAGILLGKIHKSDNDYQLEEDYAGCKDDDHPTHLVLKVKGNELTLPLGKELHPVALVIVERLIMKESVYQKPSFGGMDDHLHTIASNRGNVVFALEKADERWGEGAIKDCEIAIEASLTNATAYKWHIENTVKKPRQPQVAVAIEDYSPASFYSDELPEDKSLGLLERNDLWVTRIMKLDTERFKLAFGYVGRGHLVDLFKKLVAVGCQVSRRLSLVDLEEILLDEPAVLREHVRLKAIYRHL